MSQRSWDELSYFFISSDTRINMGERTKVFCQHSYGYMGCRPGRVLKILEADYGRETDDATCADVAPDAASLVVAQNCTACAARKVREW